MRNSHLLSANRQLCDDVFDDGLVDVEVFMNEEVPHCSDLSPRDLRPFRSDVFGQASTASPMMLPISRSIADTAISEYGPFRDDRYL
jgi:hypothetical protein